MSRKFTIALGLCLLTWSSVRADLWLEKTEVKLGEVRSGAPLYYRVQFLNQSKNAITITNIRVSCGCLQPQLPRRTYLPGEKGSIRLVVHTLGESAGKHTWNAIFTYRTKTDVKQKTLSVSANVIKEIHVEPSSLLIQTSSQARHLIRVTDTRAKPLQIKHLHTSHQNIKARILKRETNKSGQLVSVLELKVTDQLPAGRSHHVLSIISEDSTYQLLQVPMLIDKRKSTTVQATPRSLEMTMEQGVPLPSRIVLLRSESGKQVEVDRAVSRDAAIKCTWAQGPGKLSTLKLTFDETKIPNGNLKSAIDVFVSGPTPAQITIPVSFSSPSDPMIWKRQGQTGLIGPKK